MNFIMRLSFLILITAHAFAATSHDNSKVPLAYHVFTSSVYDDYLQQLQLFVNEKTTDQPDLHHIPTESSYTLFQQGGLDLIRWIENGPATNDVEDKRFFHKTMIAKLRNVINLKNKDAQIDDLSISIASFVNNLCEWMYTQPKVLKSMQTFMEETFSINYSLNLQNLYDAIDNDNRFDGTLKLSDQFHNPHPEGDIPSHLFSTYAGDNEIKFIRTSNPTFDFQGSDGKVNTAIIPEFINYLSYLPKKERLHLYVNYMARQKSDRSKTDLLEQLENDTRFGSAVAVVSLARNSDFYEQAKSYSTLHDANQFKKAFMIELFANSTTSNYYWSKKLEMSAWKKVVEAILENVHTQYFSTQKTLTVLERQEFIDVAYVKITESIVALLQPDTVNLSCAITIDRGPTAFTLLYLDLLLQQNQTIDDEQLKTIATLVYGPGVLIRNRSIDPVHQRHFINAVNRLLSAYRGLACNKCSNF